MTFKRHSESLEKLVANDILRTERFGTCTIQEHNSKFCNTEFVPAADGHIIACLQVLYYRASTLLQSKYFTTGRI